MKIKIEVLIATFINKQSDKIMLLRKHIFFFFYKIRFFFYRFNFFHARMRIEMGKSYTKTLGVTVVAAVITIHVSIKEFCHENDWCSLKPHKLSDFMANCTVYFIWFQSAYSICWISSCIWT